MLFVRVFGGLGNQIFQYVFYEYLRLNNENVFLDISDFEIHKHHYGFELNKVFGITPTYNEGIEKFKKVKQSKLNRLISKLTKTQMVVKDEYVELQHYTIVRNTCIEKDVYFNGFWQNSEYIKAIGIEKVRKMLEFSLDLEDKNLEFKRMADAENIVSVHIRRGDYLKNEEFGGICDKEYYTTAIKVAKEKVFNARFAFFSDDIAWCKENFKELENSIYVDWNSNEQSYKDMYLMTLCKGNIIANSTFSLWGAYLNNVEGALVIAPERWTKHRKTEPLMLNEHWILL